MQIYEINGVEYNLLDSEAAEVDKFSDSEPDDAKFNAWFLDFVKSKHIPPRSDASRAKYWSRIGSTPNNLARAAMVQKAVTTLVRTVSPDIKPGEVLFNSGAGQNSGKIVLPYEPVEKGDIYSAIDAVSGYGVHQAYGTKWSTLVQPKDYKHIDSRTVDNALESFRIEQLGDKEFPGFSHYLDEMYDQMYANSGSYQLPSEFPKGDENNTGFSDQFSALFSPLRYEKHVGSGSNLPYYDKIKRVRDIVREYSSLGEMATLPQLERAREAILSLMDRDRYNQPNPPMPITPQDGLGKDDGTADSSEISAAAAAEMEEGTTDKTEIGKGLGAGSAQEGYTIVKVPGLPTKTVRHLSNEIVKADAHLRLVKTRERNEDRFMRSGDLDEEELYRLYAGDDRVFINVTEEVEEEAAIYFMIDASGSMHNQRINQAAEMAWLLVHSMAKRKNITTKVFAFSGGGIIPGIMLQGRYYDTTIYRVYDPGDSIEKINWLPHLGGGGTPEGVGLNVVGSLLLQEEAPQKYMVVLCDGSPDYPELVRDVREYLEKQGVFVVQMAIGANIRESKFMYKNSIPYNNIDQTIRDFGKILDKVR